MTKEELIQRINDTYSIGAMWGGEPIRVIRVDDLTDVVNHSLDYALSEIDENIVKVIEGLKSE